MSPGWTPAGAIAWGFDPVQYSYSTITTPEGLTSSVSGCARSLRLISSLRLVLDRQRMGIDMSHAKPARSRFKPWSCKIHKVELGHMKMKNYAGSA